MRLVAVMLMLSATAAWAEDPPIITGYVVGFAIHEPGGAAERTYPVLDQGILVEAGKMFMGFEGMCSAPCRYADVQVADKDNTYLEVRRLNGERLVQVSHSPLSGEYLLRELPEGGREVLLSKADRGQEFCVLFNSRNDIFGYKHVPSEWRRCSVPVM